MPITSLQAPAHIGTTTANNQTKSRQYNYLHIKHIEMEPCEGTYWWGIPGRLTVSSVLAAGSGGVHRA